MEHAFGNILKSWRQRRRLSQIELSLAADVSARHIAFLETGKAQPSRAMVLRLSRHLNVPLAERNAWLHAAGFSGHFKARQLDTAAMLPIRSAIDHMLATHEPYPALVLDRHWLIVNANRPAILLLGFLGVGVGKSLFDVFMDRAKATDLFDNADEVCTHLARRLKTESAHYGGDPVLDEAARAMTAGLGHEEPTTALATIPVRINSPNGILSFFSVLAHFGSTEDIAVAEMKIELIFPADKPTRDFLMARER